MPPANTSSDRLLVDKEREKALYPGRVVLASEFPPPIGSERDLFGYMFRRACVTRVGLMGLMIAGDTSFSQPPDHTCVCLCSGTFNP